MRVALARHEAGLPGGVARISLLGRHHVVMAVALAVTFIRASAA